MLNVEPTPDGLTNQGSLCSLVYSDKALVKWWLFFLGIGLTTSAWVYLPVGCKIASDINRSCGTIMFRTANYHWRYFLVDPRMVQQTVILKSSLCMLSKSWMIGNAVRPSDASDAALGLHLVGNFCFRLGVCLLRINIMCMHCRRKPKAPTHIGVTLPPRNWRTKGCGSTVRAMFKSQLASGFGFQIDRQKAICV